MNAGPVPQQAPRIVAGILVVAAIATAGEWAWSTYDVCQSIAAGVIHGAVLLTAVGGAIGAASGRTVRGLPIGTLAGIGEDKRPDSFP